jgi:hypothetical protein
MPSTEQKLASSTNKTSMFFRLLSKISLAKVMSYSNPTPVPKKISLVQANETFYTEEPQGAVNRLLYLLIPYVIVTTPIIVGFFLGVLWMSLPN